VTRGSADVIHEFEDIVLERTLPPARANQGLFSVYAGVCELCNEMLSPTS
jgi:hypothetical protein